MAFQNKFPEYECMHLILAWNHSFQGPSHSWQVSITSGLSNDLAVTYANDDGVLQCMASPCQEEFNLLICCLIWIVYWHREVISNWKETSCLPLVWLGFNTLRLRQSGQHFTYNIFKCIFFNENVWIPITISLKFVPRGPITNITALVQIMAWRCPGDKPLVFSLPTHIWITRPQWVKT